MSEKNADKTCWNCPAAIFKGNVDFRACGQSQSEIKSKLGDEGQIMIECSRRPELGYYEPTISFEQCDEWIKGEYGYQLKNMRVLILGMDGYLGWPLALRLARLGMQVSGMDNLSRRKWVSDRNAHSVVPILSMEDRLKKAKEVLDVDINYREFDILNRDELRDFLEEVEPEVIVHYAENSSAPYSMMSMENSIDVQTNNTIGTLGLLWLIKEICPESSLVKLGTAGEYGSPLTGRPLFEGMFPSDAVIRWNDREWSLGGEIAPRDPVSFYHVSKVQGTYNIYECCKYWWLRSYDIMQGVVYGNYTQEIALDPGLQTRFDVDEFFGTVINRFVSQAVAGIPLTIYGSGNQIKGFITLEEAMECMVRLIISPPEPGQYDVVNQVSGLYQVKQIAETIGAIGNDKYGLDVTIQRLENPRVETEVHPLEIISTKLKEEFGLESKPDLEGEVDRMFKILTQDHVKARILEKKDSITPKTTWSGEEKELGIIETYKPGTVKMTQHKGVLHR